MSFGEALAQARDRAGLTIIQVRQQTRIMAGLARAGSSCRAPGADLGHVPVIIVSSWDRARGGQPRAGAFRAVHSPGPGVVPIG